MLGTVAVTIAIIVVASIGFLMLAGRIDLRRSASVIVGCFIIFGASIIAGGIMSTANGIAAREEATEPMPMALAPPSPPAYPQAPPQPYDPYAGAALPPQ